jgi:hypothetical protein
MPFWIPSPASARSAARLDASPTLASTTASCFASATRTSSKAARTPACARVDPPTVPTASGSSASPRSPVGVRFQVLSGRYPPPVAAQACAPASMERQSWPSATAAASSPFMKPLLWVQAR